MLPPVSHELALETGIPRPDIYHRAKAKARTFLRWWAGVRRLKMDRLRPDSESWIEEACCAVLRVTFEKLSRRLKWGMWGPREMALDFIPNIYGATNW